MITSLKGITIVNSKLVQICRELISQIFAEKKDAFCFTEIYYCQKILEFSIGETMSWTANESFDFHKVFTTKKDVFCFAENAWLGAVLVTKQKGRACVSFGLYHYGQNVQILSENYKEYFHLELVTYVWPKFSKKIDLMVGCKTSLMHLKASPCKYLTNNFNRSIDG